MNVHPTNGSIPWYRRKLVVFSILIILVLLAAGVIYWYLSTKGKVSTDDAYIDAERVSVSARVQGRISVLNFQEGDSVNVGDTLVLLEDSMLVAQVQVAQAAVQTALQDSASALVALNRAQQDLARGQIQYRNGVIPKANYDHLRQAEQQAQINYQAALTKVHSAQAQLQVALTSLGYATLVAFSSGRVAKRWVAVGDVVVPGQSIYTVYQTGHLWVTANFEETKIASIKPGDTTSIHVDAYGNSRFAGKVLWIGAATASEFSLLPPSNASGNFTKVTQRVPCRISIHEMLSKENVPYNRLIPGMSVEVVVRITP